MTKPRQERHIRKMSLLTELEIFLVWLLQGCRADGAGERQQSGVRYFNLHFEQLVELGKCQGLFRSPNKRQAWWPYLSVAFPCPLVICLCFLLCARDSEHTKRQSYMPEGRTSGWV